MSTPTTLEDLNDLTAVVRNNAGLRCLGDGFFAGETADDGLIIPGKQALARVYVDLGFYTEDDVDPVTGMFKPEHDEPHSRARYFIAGRIHDSTYQFHAMARLISYDDQLGLASFPITVEAPIDSDLHGDLESGRLPRAQEVSELVANPAIAGSSRRVVDSIYAAMFQTAVRENHEVWIIAARPVLFKQLQRRFSTDAVRQMSAVRERPGEIVIPSMIDINRVLETMASTLETASADNRQDRVIALTKKWGRYLDGLSVSDLPGAVGDRLGTFGLLET